MNTKPTSGKWMIGKGVEYLNRYGECMVVTADLPYLIADLRDAPMPKEEAAANAALIVAAVNACFALNPDNPLAVAEALPELVKAVVDFLEWGAMTGSDLELHRGKFRAALAKLERKS